MSGNIKRTDSAPLPQSQGSSGQVGGAPRNDSDEPHEVKPLTQCDVTGVGQCNPIFTIGHGNAPGEKMVALLTANQVQVLADVRSVPYSRHVPQASRAAIERTMRQVNIKYLFMGDQLGGRPQGIKVRDDQGEYDYSELAASESFQEGMSRLQKGARDHRVCLLCSEEDPVRCHRGLLISKELAKLGFDVRHIRYDGKVESQADMEKRIPPKQRGLFSER